MRVLQSRFQNGERLSVVELYIFYIELAKGGYVWEGNGLVLVSEGDEYRRIGFVRIHPDAQFKLDGWTFPLIQENGIISNTSAKSTELLRAAFGTTDKFMWSEIFTRTDGSH